MNATAAGAELLAFRRDDIWHAYSSLVARGARRKRITQSPKARPATTRDLLVVGDMRTVAVSVVELDCSAHVPRGVEAVLDRGTCGSPFAPPGLQNCGLT